MITKKILASIVGLAFLAGCATGADPNYLARLDAQRQVDAIYAQARVKESEAKVAQMVALQKIGETADPQSRQMAVMALAVLGNGGVSAPQGPMQMPMPPETNGDKALKWAAILAGPLVALGTGYYGYRLGVAQSDNQASTTIAGYNTFGQIATSGFNSNAAIAGQIQAPQPNITLSGTGVIGAGAYTHTPTTNTNSFNRNCNGGNTGTGTVGPYNAGAANC
jgi:hypothetical protein